MGATSQKSVERKRKGKKVLLYTLIVTLAILLAFSGYIYWTRFQEIFRHREKVTKLREKREKLLEENRELQERLNKRNDLDYIAKLANRKLGFVFPKKEKERGG